MYSIIVNILSIAIKFILGKKTIWISIIIGIIVGLAVYFINDICIRPVKDRDATIKKQDIKYDNLELRHKNLIAEYKKAIDDKKAEVKTAYNKGLKDATDFKDYTDSNNTSVFGF